MLLIKNAWQLIKISFSDKKNRNINCFLLAASISLELGVAYIQIILNKWNNDFYNALQNLDKDMFFKCVFTFIIFVAIFIVIVALNYISQNKLIIRLRRSMTESYLNKWIENDYYYGSNLITSKTDNIDQRIADDIDSFINLTLELSLSLMGKIIKLFSFLTILWTLSGIIKFSLFNIDFVMHGYLVWIALIYALFATLVTYKIGRELSNYSYLQEQKEANFRFSLIRFKENSENIAFYQGTEYEKKIFYKVFEDIMANFNKMIKINKNLSISTNIYRNLEKIIPIAAAFPKYFSKEIQLGGLMQIDSAFYYVQEALGFIINSFDKIAEYKAIILRLSEFNNNAKEWEITKQENKINIEYHKLSSLKIDNLTIRDNNNNILLKNLNLEFYPGKSYLINARNGAGKTTLLRAIKGIWIYGEGRIMIPEDKKIFFVPQKIYMPCGSLIEVIAYPINIIDDKYIEKIKQYMNYLNIEYLVKDLDQEKNWPIILSPGEQQKIAIIRVLLSEADILFLDESTCSITKEDEIKVYDLLKETLINKIIISIGHGSDLKQIHDQHFNI